MANQKPKTKPTPRRPSKRRPSTGGVELTAEITASRAATLAGVSRQRLLYAMEVGLLRGRTVMKLVPRYYVRMKDVLEYLRQDYGTNRSQAADAKQVRASMKDGPSSKKDGPR